MAGVPNHAPSARVVGISGDFVSVLLTDIADDVPPLQEQDCFLRRKPSRSGPEQVECSFAARRHPTRCKTLRFPVRAVSRRVGSPCIQNFASESVKMREPCIDEALTLATDCHPP